VYDDSFDLTAVPIKQCQVDLRIFLDPSVLRSTYSEIKTARTSPLGDRTAAPHAENWAEQRSHLPAWRWSRRRDWQLPSRRSVNKRKVLFTCVRADVCGLSAGWAPTITRRPACFCRRSSIEISPTSTSSGRQRSIICSLTQPVKLQSVSRIGFVEMTQNFESL